MTGLQPSREIFITCAVTGAGDTTGRSDKIPITPQEIADSCIASAKAGAAIVHIHVRDPKTGAPARDPALYAEVMNIIRESKVDMVLNFTAGMGGDMVFGSAEEPLPLNDEGTDMACTKSVARNMHHRLRHHELRRRRLCDDQYAVNLA
jgi:uncharacterized protein (DUF849 family)